MATKFGEAKCIESALITISFESLHFLPAASFLAIPDSECEEAPLAVRSQSRCGNAGRNGGNRVKEKEGKKADREKQGKQREGERGGEKKASLRQFAFDFRWELSVLLLVHGMDDGTLVSDEWRRYIKAARKSSRQGEQHLF